MYRGLTFLTALVPERHALPVRLHRVVFVNRRRSLIYLTYYPS